MTTLIVVAVVFAYFFIVGVMYATCERLGIFEDDLKMDQVFIRGMPCLFWPLGLPIAMGLRWARTRTIPQHEKASAYPSQGADS